MDKKVSKMINTSFSSKLPNLQLAWDSVSRGAMKTCPRYYQYTIIHGYTTKNENNHFIFGIGFHAGLEIYDRKRAEGLSHHKSMVEAVRYTLSYTWNFPRQRPWISDEPTKTRLTLIRAIIWYLDQFEIDNLKTLIMSNGTPAVEQSFHFDCNLTSITDEPYVLCGHLDRVVEWEKDTYIVDRKTTKTSLVRPEDTEKYFAKFNLDDQMAGYHFAGTIIFERSVKGIIIDAGQTAVNFTRFQRGLIYRSQDQLDEWYINTKHLFHQAELYAKNEYWPMNEKSCNNYGGCPFILVCSSEPKQRQKILDSFYSQRIWDPLISREI